MAVRQTVDAMTVARQFVEALNGNESVLGVWARDTKCGIEIYTVTEPLDGAGERVLFGIQVELIREYPEANVELAVINPTFFEGDLMRRVPADAQPVPLNT
jgi:hypothetical protein